jgi:hypothetical protein
MSTRDLDENFSIRRRLVRSAGSVATGLLVLAMLMTLAIGIAATAPLWLWAMLDTTQPHTDKLLQE